MFLENTPNSELQDCWRLTRWGRTAIFSRTYTGLHQKATEVQSSILEGWQETQDEGSSEQWLWKRNEIQGKPFKVHHLTPLLGRPNYQYLIKLPYSGHARLSLLLSNYYQKALYEDPKSFSAIPDLSQCMFPIACTPDGGSLYKDFVILRKRAEHFLQPERELQEKSHPKQPIIKDFSFPPSYLTPPYKKRLKYFAQIMNFLSFLAELPKEM